MVCDDPATNGGLAQLRTTRAIPSQEQHPEPWILSATEAQLLNIQVELAKCKGDSLAIDSLTKYAI